MKFRVTQTLWPSSHRLKEMLYVQHYARNKPSKFHQTKRYWRRNGLNDNVNAWPSGWTTGNMVSQKVHHRDNGANNEIELPQKSVFLYLRDKTCSCFLWILNYLYTKHIQKKIPIYNTIMWLLPSMSGLKSIKLLIRKT